MFYQKWVLILVSTHGAQWHSIYATPTHSPKPTYTVRSLVRINHKTTSRVMPIKETSPGFVMTMTASGLSHLILVFPICQRRLLVTNKGTGYCGILYVPSFFVTSRTTPAVSERRSEALVEWAFLQGSQGELVSLKTMGGSLCERRAVESFS